MPYFVTEPSDTTIGVDEDAEFPCVVEGIPNPEVAWYINGKPIDGIEILRIFDHYNEINH